MKRSSGILSSIADLARRIWSAKAAARCAALLVLAVVVPACGGGGKTIVIPNTPGTLAFIAAVFSASENSGSATITVRRSGGTRGAVSVNFGTSDGTATAADYTTAGGTLSWADGDGVDKTFNVTLNNDALVEGSETVNLTLSLATGGAVAGPAAVLTITDDDAPVAGVIQFSSATYSVNEGAGTATITVSRTGGTTGAVSVNFADAGGGTATAGGTDYTLVGGTLNWAAGDAADKTFTVTITNDALPEAGETVNLVLNTFGGGAVAGTTTAAVLTIIDNDSFGSLQFSSAAYTVTESGLVATITVTRTGGTQGAVGATFATSDGTATTAGSDYAAISGTVSWAAGDSTPKTFLVTILDDTLVEGNETVNLTLSLPTGGAVLGGTTAAVLTILDDDCTIQFTAATFNSAENIGTAGITVSRVGSTLAAVSVDFSNPAGGTATAGGTDYTFVAGTLNWAIGDGANKTISIPINSDSLAEGNETINLALSNVAGVGARLGAQTTTVDTIVDDDVQFVFSAATYNVNEAAVATITVNRVGASVGIATVDWSITGGTAAIALDYTAAPATLTWPSGDMTAKTFTITTLTDNLAEGDETVLLALGNPTLAGGNAVVGTPGAAVLTIVDDDVNLQFNQAVYTVAENVVGGTLTVTVTRTGLTTGACSVTWSASNGTATGGGTDFTAAGGTLNWAAGDGASKTFNITIVNDLIVEGTESFNLALTGPVGATLGAQSTAIVNISDDDAPGSLQYTAAAFTVGEAVGSALITVSRTGGIGNAVGVTWNITGGSATAGVDFTGPITGTLSWAAGDSADKTITVPIVDDNLVDAGENITFNLTTPTGGATLGGQTTTALNITDNDVAGSIQFTAATYNFTEAGGIVNVTVSRTGGVGNAVSVDWAIAGGTATGGGADYTATPGTLNWAAGDGANKNIVITIANDLVVEPAETILLSISNVLGGATLGGQQTATVNISDDDTNLQFTSATFNANENAGTMNLTVSRTGITTGASSVTWTITGGSATGPNVAPADYNTTPSTSTTGTLSWAAGDATNKTIVITINDDFTIEGSETINLSLSAPVGASLGSQTTTVATINDDDAPGTIQFSSATYSVGENAGTATITATRTGGVGGTVGVTYATSAGTATGGGTDYNDTTSTLSWGPGDSANKTFTVAIVPDLLPEGSETVNLTLSVPTGGATLGGPTTAVLTILDSAGSISFSSPTYSVNENGVTATITVNRSNGNGGVVGVTFATSNGSATAGSDYTTNTNTLSWADGDTAAKTFNVAIANDTLGEGDETVNLALSLPTGGAALGAQNTAVLTIVDDDTSLSFSSPTYSVNENGVTATITVNRTGVLTNPVGVTFATSDGTATLAGADYTANTNTLAWAALDGAPKIFTVAINNDALVEGSETVNLTLSLPTGGATLGAQSTAVLTIIDDDVPGTLQFSSAAYGVNENAGTITINVTRTGGSGGIVGVTFATSNGTAIAGSDYTTNTNTLSWAAGDTANKTFTVNITNDSVVDPGETFNLALSAPTGGATLGAPNTAVVTITDDDTTLQFSSPTFTVGEGAGTATISVTRVGNLTNPVGVTYATSAGTATAGGTDYSDTTNTLSWGASDGSTKTFTVSITDDATVEPGETVNLTLSLPTGGATLGAQSTAVLTITDNDGPTVTNANPPNASPNVNKGVNLVLDFSMAMDPATFVSGTTVTISPDPSGGAVAAANRLQFFWNGSFNQVTIVFDTKLPLGIFGDDVLAPGTLYTVTLVSGGGGVKSSVGTGSVPLVTNYVTTFTTNTDPVTPTLTITPGVTAGNPVPALTTVFTMTWSTTMQTTTGGIQIKNNYGYKADAQVTDIFPHNGVQSMVWSGGNTILTVTLTTGVPANALYRFETNSFNSSSGGFFNSNGELVFATAGPGGTAPTITARLPANGATGVSLDQEILIGFSAPMWPDDLLQSTKLVVSGTGVNQANLERQFLDFSGVFIRPKGGWPAGQLITVTINNTIRNAAGVLIAATSSFSFTTMAADATAVTIDGPYSTLPTGATNLNEGWINGAWKFLRSGGIRAFPSEVTVAPQDISFTESAAPFVPIKGYNLRVQNGLEMSPDNGFTGLKQNTAYKITFNASFRTTHGALISTAASANVISFTTRASSGVTARPQIYGNGGDSSYSTKPADVEADLRVDANSPSAVALTVTGLDSPNALFNPTLTGGGGGSSNYTYQSGGAEPNLTTAGNHVITYTIADGTNSISIKENMFIYNTAIFPTLNTPAGGTTTPTLTWAAFTGPMQAQAPAFAIGLVKVGNSNPSYIALLPNTATTFTLPADQALTTGTYQFLLHFFFPTDGVFQGASSEGETSMSGTFTVP